MCTLFYSIGPPCQQKIPSNNVPENKNRARTKISFNEISAVTKRRLLFLFYHGKTNGNTAKSIPINNDSLKSINQVKGRVADGQLACPLSTRAHYNLRSLAVLSIYWLSLD